jgi:hypothetical protein
MAPGISSLFFSSASSVSECEIKEIGCNFTGGPVE